MLPCLLSSQCLLQGNIFLDNLLLNVLTGFVENVYVEGDQVILLHVVEQPHFPFLAGKLESCAWKHLFLFLFIA